MFVEEIIRTWQAGKISSSYDKNAIIEMVFKSLHNTARFNGLTRRRYSTMLHSYYVGCLASDFAQINGVSDESTLNKVCLMGLLHDVGECIVGDVIYSLKHDFFKEECEKLNRLEEGFRNWFMNDILNIEDSDKWWELSEEYVIRADEMMGVVELLGISDTCQSKSKFFGQILPSAEVCEIDLFFNELNKTLLLGESGGKDNGKHE